MPKSAAADMFNLDQLRATLPNDFADAARQPYEIVCASHRLQDAGGGTTDNGGPTGSDFKDQMESLAKNCKAISSLAVCNCDLASATHVAAFWDRFGPKLTSLKFSYCTIESQVLQTILDKCSTVRDLEFEHCGFTPSLSAAAKAASFGALKHVAFFDCANLTDDDLASLAGVCAALEAFSLNTVRIDPSFGGKRPGSSGGKGGARADHPTLRAVIDLIRKRGRTLRCLNLGKCSMMAAKDLGDILAADGLRLAAFSTSFFTLNSKYFAPYACQKDTLESLSLSGTCLEEGFTQSLGEFQRLRVFRLSTEGRDVANYEPDWNGVATEVIHLLASFRDLEVLHLNLDVQEDAIPLKLHGFVKDLKDYPKLASVSLIGMRLDFAGVDLAAMGAKVAPHLTELQLCDMECVGDELVKALSSSLVNLTTLNLRGCTALEDAALTNLSGLKRLRYLNVSGLAALTDECGAAVKFAELRELHAGGCAKLGDGFATKIGAQNGSLEVVYMLGCAALGDAGVGALTKSAAKLRALYVDSPKLSDAALPSIAANCKQLRYFCHPPSVGQKARDDLHAKCPLVVARYVGRWTPGTSEF